MSDTVQETVDHAALARMAELHLQRNDIEEAFAFLMRAVNAAPDMRVYKERFLELARLGVPIEYNEPLANAFAACLRTPDLGSLLENWTGLLYADPRFHAAYGLARRQAFDPSNRVFFAGLTDFRPLFTPLFLDGLKANVVCNPVFEEFVTHVRRHLLDDLDVYERFSKDGHLTLAAALAHYALFTDFILDVSAGEEAGVETLACRIETGRDTAADAHAIAMLACYRPLHGLKNAGAILETFRESEPLAGVVREQIANPAALREMAAAIPSATDIGQGISSRVREQYESFPYPRWKALSKDTLLREWRTDECSQKAEGLLQGRKANILVAGCGTGRETTILAAIFPDAAIMAIDLSRTSLAYAAIKAREHGLENIAFRHGDILKLGALDTAFDYIAASGVLHHMADPVEGWKILCGLLKPGGRMRIGLYSETGRKAVIAARKAIARGGYPMSRDGMLRFRRESSALLDRDDLMLLAGMKDYYHLSMYRDFLFHVQEHRFDLPRIGGILKELDLVFVGFQVQPNVLAQYREMFPGDPAATDLGNWQTFEQRNPRTFQNLYTFWCRKAD